MTAGIVSTKGLMITVGGVSWYRDPYDFGSISGGDPAMVEVTAESLVVLASNRRKVAMSEPGDAASDPGPHRLEVPRVSVREIVPLPRQAGAYRVERLGSTDQLTVSPDQAEALVATLTEHGWPVRGRRDPASREDSALLYQSLFEESPDGILLLDKDLRFIDFNEATCRQLGYSREEFSRLSIADIDPVESDEEVRARSAPIFQTGRAEFDVVHRTKSGEDRDVHVITLLLHRHGEPLFYTIWRDITERVRAERALRVSEQFLQAIVDNEPECVKLIARDGSLIFMNRAGLEMIEAESLDEVKGRQIADLVTPEYRDAFLAQVEDTFEGRSGELEFDAVSLKGTRRRLRDRRCLRPAEPGVPGRPARPDHGARTRTGGTRWRPCGSSSPRSRASSWRRGEVSSPRPRPTSSSSATAARSGSGRRPRHTWRASSPRGIDGRWRARPRRWTTSSTSSPSARRSTRGRISPSTRPAGPSERW
jgi:PAS domain S-box-containing protein